MEGKALILPLILLINFITKVHFFQTYKLEKKKKERKYNLRWAINIPSTYIVKVFLSKNKADFTDMEQ